jgi:hypothetical protein
VVAKKAAKCGCGHDLVKVTVTKVAGTTAFYQKDGEEQKANLTGKYACACGSSCCQMISGKAGKCACGMDLVATGK